MPDQLFYNTGIYTCIWVLTNKKENGRKGRVMLIDARDLYVKMGKSLGDKRNMISDDQIREITELCLGNKPNHRVKIFKTTDFAYRKVQIERPLRLNFCVNDERLAEETPFKNLALSKKKNPKEREKEEAEGRKRQDIIKMILKAMPNKLYKDWKVFSGLLEDTSKNAHEKLPSLMKKAIFKVLSERDETAEIVYDDDGFPMPDTELRDHKYVPYEEDIYAYFEREIKPYVPDAWINEDYRDEKDNIIDRVGYEINFNRYFYKYQPPRSLEEIDNDIELVEKDILDMLKGLKSRSNSAHPLNPPPAGDRRCPRR